MNLENFTLYLVELKKSTGLYLVELKNLSGFYLAELERLTGLSIWTLSAFLIASAIFIFFYGIRIPRAVLRIRREMINQSKKLKFIAEKAEKSFEDQGYGYRKGT